MHGIMGWKERIIISLLLLCFVFTAFSQSGDEAVAKNKIALAASHISLSPSDVQDAIILKNYTDRNTGIQHLYLQQTYQGVPVYNSIKTLAFKNDKLLYSSGEFSFKIKGQTAKPTPTIQPAEAIGKAALHLHLPVMEAAFSFVRNETINHTVKQIFSAKQIAKQNIETGLCWVADSLGKWHLAWNVSIDVANSPDWWNVRVDAATGVVINKNNFTVYEKNNDENKPSYNYFLSPNGATNASYNVVPFPAENLNISNISTVTNPWEAAGTNNMATTLGWQYDGTTTYNISRGNNVFAYDDSANKNAPGSVATSVTALPNLSFSFTPDFNLNTSLSVNKSAAITNLFYWNNLMHDVMYQYGFDEPAGNFQANNLGRGGLGNDLVLAESHDGSGLNNSNFSTPDDGTSGRMQMYLWNAVKLPSFIIKTPSFIAGSDSCTESSFNGKNKLITVGPISGAIVLYNTDTLACSDTLPTNLKGRIALIYRGSCTFAQKVKNAQNAGAIAVVMVNTQGTSLLTMSGTDTSIIIPAILISYNDGLAISNALKTGNAVTATLTGTPLLDGDFDNGIICHEYGHGITHRLTGANASCMANNERPDEGWSDYFALMMTQNWAKTNIADSAKPRTIGTYVVGESSTGRGIRAYPYCTNMVVNPHTYKDLLSNGEVHYIGEVWCSALWDMTWAIIKQEGIINTNIYDAKGNGGNVMALQLVIEGEKLQPCSPGFLDARDAILAADSILYNSRHKCAIWNVFARRGMGWSAVQGSSYNTSDGTAAFDAPSLRLHTETLPPINDELTTKITVSCECGLPQSNYQLIDTIPAAFTIASSSPQALVQGNNVAWSLNNFTTVGQSNVYSVTLLPNDTAGCTLDTVLYDDRDAHMSGGFASTMARGSAGWTTSTTRAHSGMHSWYAPDEATASDFSLISNAFVPTDFSVLSFYHHFNTEAGYDGGMIDVSTDGGNTWISTAPYFISNGYNGNIYAFNPADTSYGSTPMPAFTGGSKDSDFVHSFIDLSSFSGKPLKLRFRMYTDLGTSYDGWYVDDITVTNGCGGLQHISLQNNNSYLVSAEVGNFNTDSNGVVQPAFADVSARAVNNISSLVHWTTVSEFHISNFIVERSTDSLNFTPLDTVNVQGVGFNYSVTDNQPAAGKNYYRIRMVDKNGNTKVISPVRSVVFVRNGVITLVPNPAVSKVTVLLDPSFNAQSVFIYDMQGRKIYNATIGSGATYFPIAMAGFASGVYVVKVVSANRQIKTVKLMVMK